MVVQLFRSTKLLVSFIVAKSITVVNSCHYERHGKRMLYK
jgi:hypothetical protein